MNHAFELLLLNKQTKKHNKLPAVFLFVFVLYLLEAKIPEAASEECDSFNTVTEQQLVDRLWLEHRCEATTGQMIQQVFCLLQTEATWLPHSRRRRFTLSQLVLGRNLSFKAVCKCRYI